MSVNNTEPCDDGDDCTENDICAGGLCTAGAPIDCDDNITCTVDDCTDGVCSNTPDDGACDDSNPNTTDTCDPENGHPVTGCLNTPIAAGPELQNAVSRRTHGGAGAFDRPMTPGASATDIEGRMGSAVTTPQAVLTFDIAIEATDGTADCGTEVVVSNGTCNGVSISGSTLTVDMTFDKNKCVVVTLSGIRGAGGGAAMAGQNEASVLTHEGNVNSDDNVNLLDLNDIKLALFQAVGAGNFISDINADAAINLLDLNATKINLFVAKPTCP
jgi:hypothetical protein